MEYPSARRNARAFLFATLVLAIGGLFSTPALGDAYDPPVGYYSTATGTGTTLKTNLYTITKTGFTQYNYGDARYTLNQLWQDPNNTSNLIDIYNQQSVTGTWDRGVTWNREHIVPEYTLGISGIQNSNHTYGADLFDLAPADPNTNSTRSNYAYGYTGVSAPAAGFGKVTGTDSNIYWYAGSQFTGDAARSVFYMATRYGQSQGTTGVDSGNAYNLTVANGPLNNTGQMGDLNTLLHWAYEDPVDTFERRKNSLIYSGMTVSGADASQHNRNPYIDHPEYIWAVFGTSANNSQISVATPAADGTSSSSFNLGRVIAGTAFTAANVTVSKSGVTPTTFNVATTGSATSSLTGTGETFTYNPGSKSMAVGLGTSSTAGAISGTVVVDNTDLTSAAAGQGVADGNDTVTLTGTAVDHSVASFSTASSIKKLTLSFGTFQQNTGTHTLAFSIANLLTASGYTAGLDLDSIGGTGNTSALFTSLSTFSNETAGTSNGYLADLSSASVGVYSAEYTLAVSDENIPGATAGQSLILDLSGTITSTPEPGSLVVLAFSGVLFVRRRRSI